MNVRPARTTRSEVMLPDICDIPYLPSGRRCQLREGQRVTAPTLAEEDGD